MVTYDTASSIIEGFNSFGYGPKMYLKPWPILPFETKDVYIDFNIGTNLYASEKLSEINIEDIFRLAEKFFTKEFLISNTYSKWKCSMIRDLKINMLL